MLLRLATDEELRARDRLTYQAWGDRLSVDEFAAREQRLRGHKWAAAHLESWLLVDGAATLSSCELFRMRSFLRAPGGWQAGLTFGVASVFTEPSLRRQGYAARMMALLVEQMRGRRAQASVLFSDVGDYYARAGYQLLPAIDRELPSAAGDPARPVDRLLTDEELGVRHAEVPLPEVGLAIWPEADQLDWHRERERAYAALLGRSSLPHAGALAGRGSIAWAADFKHDKLVVLYLHAERLEELTALVEAAAREAAAAGLDRVSHWEAPLPFPWPAGLGTAHARSHSLPMICPFDPAVSVEAGVAAPRAVWI
jgi:hypothetical protein